MPVIDSPASPKPRRPIPIQDEQSEPFWRAAGSHVLTAARCARCQNLCHPPDVVCPRCGTTDPGWEFIALTGKGTVRSWTVMRQSFMPGFEGDLPFVLVDVQLTEDPHLRMIGRLLDGPEAELFIGATVTVAFEDVAPGVSVPAFNLGADE